MKTNLPQHFINKIKAKAIIGLALIAATLTFSSTSMAAPLNSPYYNGNNSNYNSPLSGIDRAIRGQDRQIRQGERDGSLTGRESQIAQSNAGNLKSLRSSISMNSRVSRHEIMEISSLVRQNQYTITRLLSNRERSDQYRRSGTHRSYDRY